MKEDDDERQKFLFIADAHVKALKEFVFELGKKMEAMGDAE